MNRLEVIKAIEEKRITQGQASQRLGISTRQVKRLCRNYRERGAGVMMNKMRGKASHNQLKESVIQQVLDLILERYRDIGPTLATEKLVELHGITISDESVRKVMIAEGIWKQRRKRKYRVFQMRERRSPTDTLDYQKRGKAGSTILGSILSLFPAEIKLKIVPTFPIVRNETNVHYITQGRSSAWD